MNNMGVEEEGKRVEVEVVDLLCFDDWIDETQSAMILLYI
jgi:hypothetical protein